MQTRSTYILSGLLLVLLALGALPVPGVWAQEILIGTGSRTGELYQVGRAICRVINRNADGLTCEARPTEAGDTTESMANLFDVQGGAIEIGLALSDSQYHAVKGTGQARFMDVKFDNLRALFSIHSVPFTVVARRDSAIKRFDDLKGKRVNIGSPGSVQRATMEEAMKAKGWTKKDFLLAEELPAAQQSLALCHGQVQAMVDTVSHPDETVGQATRLCQAAVIDVSGPEIDGLIAEKPYYAPAVIPGGTYRDSPDEVRSFGTKVTVVTSSDVSEELVRTFVETVFDNLDQLKRMHPAFKALEPGRMIKDGLTAPLHEGALSYFRTKGLM